MKTNGLFLGLRAPDMAQSYYNSHILLYKSLGGSIGQ